MPLLFRLSPRRRFFVPPYLGHRGWVGLRLDVEVDWDGGAGLVEERYRMAAPKRFPELFSTRHRVRTFATERRSFGRAVGG